MSDITPAELLEKFEYQFSQYSRELRATTQPFALERVRAQTPDYQYHPEDPLVREPLMEHIGSLPMVATTLYPYINDPEVDLGRALTMLAIHDIGELTIGDKIDFSKLKTTEALDEEQLAAYQLLDPSYHELYTEMETRSSRTAQFAKAVDKITPDIYDYLTPVDATLARFKHYVGIDDIHAIVPLIEQHKRPYMLWNPFLTEFHILLLERINQKLLNYE